MKSLVLTVLVLAALFLPGCVSPGATELPSEPEDSVPTTQASAVDSGASGAHQTPATAATESRPSVELPVEILDYKGVRGGKIVCDVDGSKDEVVAMLLDFDHADGKRAWAKTYKDLGTEGEKRLAFWSFEGKSGINPEVVLVFETITRGDAAIIRYRLREPVFGLAAFFGDWRVTPLGRARSRLTMRVYIDSGVLIANATEEDISDGLREDARLIDLWMKERLTKK